MLWRSFPLFLVFWSPLAISAAKTVEVANPLTPIDVSGFHDSAHHWRFFRDESRVILVEPNQPSYAPEQVREIVANILLFQRDNGGWPKDYDMTAVLTEAQKATIQETHAAADTSFDNGNIHSQVTYLARAYAQSPEPSWRAACERGFDFLLAAQYPNGGFPQRYPGAKDFHAHITFNDFVTIGILEALNSAATDEPHFQWLDSPRRKAARDAVRRGLDCILRCQIRVDGKLTGWCQQHDRETFEPRPARSFELVSICPQDTTAIVRFLMEQKKPSPAMIQAVDAAVRWLEKVRLSGIRVEKVAAPKEEFAGYTSEYDKAIVNDPQAPPLWARHYEIGTDRPVFAGRDGVRKYTFGEMERERRTGTPWFGTWPARLLEKDYPKWREKVRRID
jgi:PelA/Pel-15E family pectate lyase